MGDNRNNRGMSKSKLYRKWIDMKRRCFNKNNCNYEYYGARGISVCEEWLGVDGFKNFRIWALGNGYMDGLSIDRTNNDKDYSPENCRWVSKRIQNINKRPTNPNTSGYVGIRKHSSGTGWYGSVKVNNKDCYTGYSENLLEAVIMCNEYIVKNNLSNNLNEVS